MHATDTDVPLATVAVPIVGAPGTVGVTGVTEFDAADATDVPAEFVAVTVKVYAVPVVKPETVIALVHVAAVNVPVMAVPTAVAVYLVIVAPPFDVGAVQATVTDVGLAMVAVPIVGASGTDTAGVTELDAVDKLDVPTELVAVVLKKYVVPFVKPVITHEPEAPVIVQPVEYSPPAVVDRVTV